MMRRAGIAIALVWCACGKSADQPKPAAIPLAPLVEAIDGAARGPDPVPSLLAALAKACGAGCPCLDAAKAGEAACAAEKTPIAWAGRYIAESAKAMSPEDRTVLDLTLQASELWVPEPAAVVLPKAEHAQGATGWATMIVTDKGAMSVARGMHVRFTVDGAEIEPAVAAQPAADLAALDHALEALAPPSEDPPPPEEEEVPEEDSAMELDEGRMGKKDSDRAEGQYAIKNREDQGSIRGFAEPRPAHCDDMAGGFTYARSPGPPGDPVGEGTIGMGEGWSGRARSIVELVKTTAGDRPIVLADGGAPITTVFPLLLRGHVALGVESGGRPSALAMVVCSAPAWGLDLVPVKLEAGESPADVRAAYQAAGIGDGATAELLVSERASYGDVVGALDALLEAGAEHVALRSMPVDAATGKIRDIPQVRIGQPSAVGDLDKAIIRRYIKRNLAKISDCYEQVLAKKPGLTGTVSTQFFIAPTGKVASANASGVDPDVSSCLAGVLKSIEFPKPKGGGGVQVSYPFTFRPTGG